MCQSKDYVYGLMTGLFAWISFDWFVVDLCYVNMFKDSMGMSQNPTWGVLK